MHCIPTALLKLYHGKKFANLVADFPMCSSVQTGKGQSTNYNIYEFMTKALLYLMPCAHNAFSPFIFHMSLNSY